MGTDDNRDFLRRVCPDVDPSEWSLMGDEYVIELADEHSTTWRVLGHSWGSYTLTLERGWYEQTGDADTDDALGDLAAAFVMCVDYLGMCLDAAEAARVRMSDARFVMSESALYATNDATGALADRLVVGEELYELLVTGRPLQR